MKKTEARSVGDIINDIIATSGQTENFDRQKACYLWGEVVGPYVNRMTIRRQVNPDGTMHVYIASAVLKSELSFTLETLRARLNEAVGSDIIKKIVIH